MQWHPESAVATAKDGGPTFNPETSPGRGEPGPQFAAAMREMFADTAERAAKAWTPDHGERLTVTVRLDPDFLERVRAGERIL